MDIKKYEPLWGNWYIKELIGKGGFGEVYVIERKEFGDTYRAALKHIKIPRDQSEVESLRDDDMTTEEIREYYLNLVKDIVKEYKLMSQLKGRSNIVSYEDHNCVENSDEISWDIFIRMELLTPLFTHVKSIAADRRTIIKLGIDICKALELCQKHNIIHRDIKPENIFVSDDGDFKLGDFGIARTMESTVANMSKKGTYTYIAPEVYRGERYGSTVDIYSLGIVMYRLLNNNRTPFMPPYPTPIRHTDREEALFKRLSGGIMPPPANAEGRLAEIVLKACAYDPKDRYSSPAQLRTELEAIMYNEHEAKIIYPEGDRSPVPSVDYLSTQNGEDETKTLFAPRETEEEVPEMGENSRRTSEGAADREKAAEVEIYKTDYTDDSGIVAEYGENSEVTDKPAADNIKNHKPETGSITAEINNNTAEMEKEYKQKPDTYTQAEEEKEYKQKPDTYTQAKEEKEYKQKPDTYTQAKKENEYKQKPDTYIQAKEEKERKRKQEAYIQAKEEKERKRKQDIYDQAKRVFEHTKFNTDDLSLNKIDEYIKSLEKLGNFGRAGELLMDYMQLREALEKKKKIMKICLSVMAVFMLGIMSIVSYSNYKAKEEEAAEEVRLEEKRIWQERLEQERLAEEERLEQERLEKERLEKLRLKREALANQPYMLKGSVDVGKYHLVNLKADGTVVATGDNYLVQCNVSGWSGIKKLATGYCHTVGLKADGTVLAIGINGDGQCNVSGWSGIVDIAAEGRYTLGLKADGTVAATGVLYTGFDTYKECNVSSWNGIKSISANVFHAVGLRSDGTVVAVDGEAHGRSSVADWTDIVEVSAGEWHTVGLKSDGTVVATGNNDWNQCNVDNWSDIVKISAGNHFTLGLDINGNVKCTDAKVAEKLNSISDIVDIYVANSQHNEIALAINSRGEISYMVLYEDEQDNIIYEIPEYFSDIDMSVLNQIGK